MRGSEGTCGESNVCAPTLANLANPFGLSSLIGKTLAIISDTRLGGRSDQAAIAEALLSISEEDTKSVPRKFLPDWTGKLNTRFMILTNELPRIADSSGALASRFILLTLKHSFYGREDIRLFNKLKAEQPGILQWALRGWTGYQALDKIIQPESALEAMRDLEDLGSPTAAFLRERCVQASGQSVEVSDLYAAWKSWCESIGRTHAGTMQTFGRDLRAAAPGIHLVRPRVDGERVRRYEGIGVRYR